MKQLLLCSILCTFSLLTLFAQHESSTYYTLNASLEVRTVWQGEVVIFRSHEVSIALDYETAEMRLHLPVHSLESGIEVLDTRLRKEAPEEIDFTGKLGLAYINTNKHPPIDLEFEGVLDWDSQKVPIRGEGQLLHINDQGQLVACMLGLETRIKTSQLGIKEPALADELEIILIQALLEQDKN